MSMMTAGYVDLIHAERYSTNYIHRRSAFAWIDHNKVLFPVLAYPNIQSNPVKVQLQALKVLIVLEACLNRCVVLAIVPAPSVNYLAQWRLKTVETLPLNSPGCHDL